MTIHVLLLLLCAAPTANREVKLDPAGGKVVMDYLGYEAEKDRVWAPGGNTRFVRASILPDGKLRELVRSPTSKGVRVVVVTATGVAYAADSAGGRLLVFSPP